jgi:hypothetical protein
MPLRPGRYPKMKDHYAYMKEEFSDEFLEQCRIRVHGGRDITMNCTSYLMSQMLLHI